MLDFGLARLRDGNTHSLTRSGTVIGTVAYMSPEQALLNPKKVDPRTDIWSLGALIFRALAGATVHNERNHADGLIAAATRTAEPIGNLVAIEPALAAIVDRALAFEKEDRFQSAAEMRDALRTLIPAGASYTWQPVDTTALPSPATAPPAASISVTFSEPEASDNIVVTFEDDAGITATYQLRPSDSGFEVIEIDDFD